MGDVARLAARAADVERAAGTGAVLAELGFAVLSREARAAPLGVPGLRELPVGVDWFAHDHGRRLSPEELGELIAGAITAGGPVGVMFHHAVMDADDLRRASGLLGLLAGHERVRAARMMELVA